MTSIIKKPRKVAAKRRASLKVQVGAAALPINVVYGLPRDSKTSIELAEFKRRVTSSPESARAFLRGMGMLTPTGKLTKRFGG